MNERIDLTNIRGKPKVYKGIEIYPVQIKDCEEFYKNLYVLQFDKNSIPDIQIVRMSYLTFLYSLQLMQDEKGKFLFETLIIDLISLLELVLHKKAEEDFYLNVDEKGLHLIFKTKDGELEFKSNDFEKLKKIIFKQNVIPYDDEILNPELKKAIQEAREFMYNKTKDKLPTFEEQICCYHCALGLTYKDIDELTIYQFTKGLERRELIISYQVYGTAIATGMASGEIPNWSSHIPERGLYDDVTIDGNELEKIASQVK
ncbi:TPA: hypothetical protein ACXDAY_002077 [Clostridium botulinum]|uniref:hypothetical protein n=1 Tax=Clostridium botulinum TaxID=1491 RepID=UPI00046753C3|nr:hypothetical protein [Clostridium botulinum]APH20981.1 hypothetical protein NPD1_4297 [Clostridium botulinum]APQ71116.1 hypothetical protein RSJ8_4254 [Clostridium botulinum]APR02524.1 hypothetical protein RSJ2_4112 [Clostridium botulinum]AUN01619.1 hypothetical protein RSJ19_01180 [Clostridium botulinum]MBN3351949.1 hypothetical protein [Clostridium botulinum]